MKNLQKLPFADFFQNRCSEKILYLKSGTHSGDLLKETGTQVFWHLLLEKSHIDKNMAVS